MCALATVTATARLFDAFHLLDAVRPGLLARSKWDYEHRFCEQASGACQNLSLCDEPPLEPLNPAHFVCDR